MKALTPTLFRQQDDLFHHTSLHALPIAHSRSMTTEQCAGFIGASIPVYSRWPKRQQQTTCRNLIDLYDRRPMFQVGELKPLGLIIENKSVVLHAQLLYCKPDHIASEIFDSLDLMTLTVDRVQGDPTSGRLPIGLSRAILTPRPDAIGS